MSDYTWRDAAGVLADVLPKDLKSEEILWCSRNEWSYDDYRAMKRLGVDPRDHESPLAAFSTALLSEPIVEAAAKVLKGWDMYSHQSSEHFEKDATEVLTAIVAAIGAEGERSGY